MKIKKIITQSRRDFTAIYECGHCGYTETGSGYDDDYFHRTVIPAKICKKCGKTASGNYRPLSTKYSNSLTV